tara:strand:+ start:731 stop:961 length:231 start_codon:yes stop_codon:yes gene_type:complete
MACYRSGHGRYVIDIQGIYLMAGLLNKPGLYANIHAKRKRIARQKAAGKTPERMRKPGSKGAPTDKAFKDSEKTAK